MCFAIQTELLVPETMFHVSSYVSHKTPQVICFRACQLAVVRSYFTVVNITLAENSLSLIPLHFRCMLNSVCCTKRQTILGTEGL